MFDEIANPPKGKGKERDVGKRRAYVPSLWLGLKQTNGVLPSTSHFHAELVTSSSMGFLLSNICVLKPLLYPAVENSHTILSPISSITITSTSCAPLMCFSFLYHITYYLDRSVALYAISQ